MLWFIVGLCAVLFAPISLTHTNIFKFTVAPTFTQQLYNSLQQVDLFLFCVFLLSKVVTWGACFDYYDELIKNYSDWLPACHSQATYSVYNLSQFCHIRLVDVKKKGLACHV